MENPPPAAETPQKKEITIPTQTAKTLGKGFQELFQADLDGIAEGLTIGVNEEFIGDIQEGYDRLQGIITGLQTANVIKIKEETAGRPTMNWLFEFEGEDQSPVQPGEVIIDKSLFPTEGNIVPINRAVNHEMRTPLALMIGYGEMLDPNAGSKIVSGVESITAKLEPFKNPEAIKIITNESGTILTPVQPSSAA